MASKVKLAGQQLALMRLTVDLMRAASTAYFLEANFSSGCDAILLCMGVAIGQLEGRPMSALKLSQYIGMPRATVMRKLNELHMRGLVERPTRNKYTLPVDELNRPEVTRAVAALARRVRDTSTELSRMDS